MAMEKPIVSTSIGAEGLPVANGEEIVLADTPETFADAVVGLLQQEDRATAIGKRAAAKVREQFGWDTVADSFAAICERAMFLSHRFTQMNTDQEKVFSET
jgi:glycosyltransferase involved in cell wall biosynthesis